jgi:hypothetical protein
MARMVRFVCTLTAFALTLLQGASALRLCACLDAAAKPACCETKLPCCVDGKCTMHADQATKLDKAFDLYRALDAVVALPVLLLQPTSLDIRIGVSLFGPSDVRVRSPDLHGTCLRAPPVNA